MTRNILLLVLSASLIIVGCKSGKNSLEKGNYYEAVMQSIKRLRKNPDNKNAKQTLHNGYPLAQDYHEGLIARLKTSNDQFKWERVHEQYQTLNRLNDEIERCPVCRPLTKSRRAYNNEANQAALKAAEVRYALGDQSMGIGTRQSAKDAFFHFKTAKRYQPGFRNVDQKIAQAREMATLQVLVERIPIHSQALQISNQFFQDKINEYLINTRINDFVRFHTPRQNQNNGIGIDHIVLLRFDDFVVGQHYIKETVEKVTRDSVVIGKQGRGENPVYGTVSAELRTFRKTVDSNGLLDFQVIDNNSQRVLTRDKFPGGFAWTCEWGSFNGDERALSKEQLALCKGREQMPPPPQQLFIEFTKPIYDQVTGRMRGFYRNY